MNTPYVCKFGEVISRITTPQTCAAVPGASEQRDPDSWTVFNERFLTNTNLVAVDPL